MTKESDRKRAPARQRAKLTEDLRKRHIDLARKIMAAERVPMKNVKLKNLYGGNEDLVYALESQASAHSHGCVMAAEERARVYKALIDITEIDHETVYVDSLSEIFGPTAIAPLKGRHGNDDSNGHGGDGPDGNGDDDDDRFDNKSAPLPLDPGLRLMLSGIQTTMVSLNAIHPEAMKPYIEDLYGVILGKRKASPECRSSYKKLKPLTAVKDEVKTELGGDESTDTGI